MGRDWHGHDGQGLSHGGQGERHAGRGHAGGREGNHGGQGDVIHDQRVVAMVERTKVTTDTESFLWRGKKSLKVSFTGKKLFTYLYNIQTKNIHI